jgi:hypothetical protein
MRGGEREREREGRHAGETEGEIYSGGQEGGEGGGEMEGKKIRRRVQKAKERCMPSSPPLISATTINHHLHQAITILSETLSEQDRQYHREGRWYHHQSTSDILLHLFTLHSFHDQIRYPIIHLVMSHSLLSSTSPSGIHLPLHSFIFTYLSIYLFITSSIHSWIHLSSSLSRIIRSAT